MSNYFELQNAPVLTTPSALTAPKITSIGYPGDDTAADPAGGQTITLTGEGFEAGASVIVNNAAVGVVSVVSSTTITFTSPALSTGSYPVYVVNTDGGTAIAVPGIQYSGTPTWTTAAGSLGSYTETQAISNTVTATGDAPISYSLFSGTLPTGSALNSANGLISGTSPLSASPTTYTFTIRATDAQQQDTNRQFSLTINPDVVTWSSPANGTTYTSTVNSAISNVALSATAASGQSVNYTANALPTGLSLSGSNITGTPTVVANSSTLLTATAATTNVTATRTINWVISVANDPDFEYVTTLLSASNPSSTFVTDASTNNFAVTVNGDTRPNNFGPYTPGLYSFNYTTKTNFVSVSAVSNLTTFTGDFTFEAWVYPNDTTVTNWSLWDARQNGSTAQAMVFNIEPLASPVTGQGRLLYYNGTYNYGTGIVYYNTWTHIAFVRSGSAMTFYINGVAGGTATVSGTQTATATSNPIYIGSKDSGISGFGTSGFISNFRIVNGTAVYTSNFTPSTTPLTAVANTVLLTAQSNRFIDNSTNNYTLTASSVSISGFDPFIPNSSYNTYGSGYFDGTGDYLSLSYNSAISIISGDFTVEMWIYRTAGSAEQYLWSNRSDTPGTGWEWRINSTNLMQFFFTAGSSLTSASTIPVNTWTHLAVTRQTNTVRMFINGTQDATATFSNGTDTSAALYIGWSTSSGGLFTGYITDARLVKGTAVYTSNFTPPAAPLSAIANTSLLTLQNNQPNNNNMFLDSSTNNFLITRNGNTTQGSFSPYGGGWSNYFDGTGDYLTAGSSISLSGNFTVEVWLYRTSTSGNGNYLFGLGNDSLSTGATFFVDPSTGYLRIYTGQAHLLSGTSSAVSLNTWNHIAFVRSSNTLRAYLNGVQVDTASWSSTISGTAYINAELNGNPTSTVYVGSAGYFSSLRVVTSAVYTSAFTPPTAPLTAVTNTQLLTCADNRFIDDSANNFTITRNGDVSIQRFNPFNPVLTAPTSYSGYFDGTGDYLTTTFTSAGSSDFCLECWVFVSNVSSNRYLFSQTNTTVSSNADIGFAVLVTSASKAAFYWNFNTTQPSVTSTNNVNLNQWNHIAAVRSGSTFTIYVNGTGTSTTSSGTINVLNSTPRNYIGYFTPEGNSTAMIGYMSNLRLVIGSPVYTSNFTPSTSPLTAIANTSLLTCQNATFIDNSTNNFAITVFGNSQPTQFNPFGWTSTTGSSAAYSVTNYGGSMYFDGTGDFLLTPSDPAFTLGSSGNFTIECWFYLLASPDNYAPLATTWTDASLTSGYLNRWALGFFNNRLTWYTSAGNINVQDSVNIVLNQWNHVAMMKSGSTFIMYKNGVLVGSNTTTDQNYTTQGALRVGSVPSGGTINGYITNLRILRGQALYASNFAPAVAPLPAVQNSVVLLNGTGAAMYDSSMITTYETIGDARSTGVIKKYGNSSIYFDGTADRLVAPPTPAVAFGTGNFTIEAWVYSADVSSSTQRGWFQTSDTIGGLKTTYTTGVVIGFGQNGSGIPLTGAVWCAVAASSFIGSSSAVVTVNTWNHIAVVRSSGITTIYVNGSSVASGSTPGNCTGTNLAVGGYYNTSYLFNGYIDDLRITNGVARYTSTFTPPTTPFMQN